MKVLIFGGTTEGRKLSKALSGVGIDVTLSVATQYGQNIAASECAKICSGRLDEDSMANLLKQGTFDYVIDATHPYAVFATQNIQSACRVTGTNYLRLNRPDDMAIPGVTYTSDISAAVEILNKGEGKALLTIGSKELEPFTHIPNYADRIFIRILPMPSSLEKALELGFRGSNIICMQGPFDMEMNRAMLKMIGAKYLVTKDSGDVGGFEAKVSAALGLGCEVITIARPFLQEDGYSFSEILRFFNATIVCAKATKEEISKKSTFFPLFVDIGGKRVLVIGGGEVARRRIQVLLCFGADVIVLSPKNVEYIEYAASRTTIRLLKRSYKVGDIEDLNPFFVIAVTDDRQANHDAMTEASSLNIPISVADCREECTCYFPAIAESRSYVAGLVSKNGNHSGVKRMAEKVRTCIQ